MEERVNFNLQEVIAAAQGTEIRDQLISVVGNNGGNVNIDLSDLKHLSANTQRYFLVAQKVAKELGGEVVLTNVSDKHIESLEYSEVSRVIRII